jgi:hypothetical protein
MTSIKLVTVTKQVANNNIAIQKAGQSRDGSSDPPRRPAPPAQLRAHWAKNNNFRKRTERKVKEPPVGSHRPVPVPRSILRSLVPNSSRNATKRRRGEKRICLVSRRPPAPARPLSLPGWPGASRAGGAGRAGPGRAGPGGRRRGKFAPRLPPALTLRPASSRQLPSSLN